MSIRQFIGHLKGADIGRIYWHNFCVQFRADLIDKGIAQQVFRIASVNSGYRKAASVGAPKYDPSFAARQAIYLATAENTLALSASRVGPQRSDLPALVSTVISVNTFEEHCTKDAHELRNMLIAASINLGASPFPAPPATFGLKDVFSALYRRGIRRIDKDKLPGVTSNILPYVVLRTRFARFWLAGDPTGFPNDPDDVRDLFGLGYLKQGDWLIRISIPTDNLVATLGVNANLIKRPVAFCVNDDEAPRFRGTTKQDHSNLNTMAPSKNGITARLDKIEALVTPDDGEMEWVSPQVALGQTGVQFDLLGEVSGTRSKPTNADFEAYLKKELPLSDSDEQAVIDALA